MHRAVPGLLTFGAVFGTANLAHAYVGPGAGLTAIGAAVAFVVAMVLAVLGFIWYPIKRLLRRKKRQ